MRRWREARLCDGGHDHGGPRRRGDGGQACDGGGAAPSILDVEAQPAVAQVLPRRRPPPAATQRRWAIWTRRRPSSSTATVTLGVSVGPGSGPDGPRSGLDSFFFIFKNPFFMSVGNDRYYKPFIFCIVQIVSVAKADTKYRFNTTNTFCSSVFS
jgi:hypothetical protein